MDDIKRIHFERTGGFAGIRMAADFELDDLPEDQARQLRELLDEADLEDLPKPAAGQNMLANGFSYVITVEAEGQQYTLTTGEEGVTEKMQPLLDLLNQIARQQMRKKKD
jgi:hypothetical protein